MLIENGRIEVEVETETGRLTRIRHRVLGIDLVTETRLAENFRLLVPLPGWRGHYIHGRDQRLTSAGPTANGAVLTWSGLRSSQGGFDIIVRLGIELRDDDIEFRLALENRSGVPVEEAIFPAIGGMANRSERDRWRLHHPSNGGAGREWAFYDEFPGTYLGPAEPVWISPYPGAMSMPWIDLYDASARRGVMLANLDPRPQGAVSMAFAQLSPCSSWRGSRQSWPDPAEAGDTPVGMTLAWASFPFLDPGRTWESPPVALHFHEGTWWAAAGHYRSWFDRTMPLPVDKSRSWLSEQDAWQSTIISYPEDSIGYRFTELPQLAAAARDAGIHVLQLDGWDIGGIDRAYPQYMPDPRLGSADELRDAIATCRGMGVEVLLFTNLQWAHMETDWWRQELHQYASQDPRGFHRNSMGWEYHTLLGLANQCESRMVAMNPAHAGFDRAIRDQLLQVARLGPAGTQIDKLNGALGIDYAPDLDLPRDEAMVGSVWRTLRAIHDDARAENPDYCIAAECHWDRIMPLVDASYSRFFTEDHLPTHAAVFPEYRQTCCVVGHYDYGLVNNCIRHGHVVNVEARCLHGSAADAPRLAGYVRQALELRRSLWDVLWHGRPVDPFGTGVEADEGLLWSRRDGEGRSAVILNHFADGDRHARISLDGEGPVSVTVHSPGREPVEMKAPLDITIGKEEVKVVTWNRQ